MKMKKENVLSFLIATGLVAVCSPSANSVFASSGYGGGSGTKSNPYLISTPQHLNQLQIDVNTKILNTKGKYYKLTNDIDLTGYDNDSNPNNGNFKPIGDPEYWDEWGDRDYE